MKIQATSGNTTEPITILSFGPEDESPILRINLRDNTNHELEPYMKRIYFEKSAFADYYTFRLLYLNNIPFFMVGKLVKTGADCLEKILKLFILSYNPRADIKKFSHNLEKLRQSCEKINSFYFNSELKIFCEEYSQKMQGFNGHQIFGYADNSVIETWQADAEKILNLVDEVFLETLLKLNDNIGFSSDIFPIYLKRGTAIFAYQPNFDAIWNTLFAKNNCIEKIYNENEELILGNIIPV
jgi:hypothetical protein